MWLELQERFQIEILEKGVWGWGVTFDNTVVDIIDFASGGMALDDTMLNMLT